MNELDHVLKHLNTKAAPGSDKTPNKILKNLDQMGKKYLLDMINKSFMENIIPTSWKLAKIIMIEKKDDDKHNKNNYRPIILTSAISKIVERLIKNRLIDYLESNSLITKYQSGFRSSRRVIDKLPVHRLNFISNRNASKPLLKHEDGKHTI